MDAILNFIFFTIVAIYVLGFLGRLFFRLWIRRHQQNFAKQWGSNPFGANFGGAPFGGAASGEERPAPEGKITVEQKTPPAEKRVSRNVGDYVDYEELEKES